MPGPIVVVLRCENCLTRPECIGDVSQSDEGGWSVCLMWRTGRNSANVTRIMLAGLPSQFEAFLTVFVGPTVAN